jgi:hypothetical protein
MPISIKQLVLNTKVSKKNDKSEEKPQPAASAGLTKFEKEAIISECLRRVKDMIDYELNP